MPEPLGPMIAWTSPGPTSRSMPWRISRSGAAGRRDAEAADDEAVVGLRRRGGAVGLVGHEVGQGSFERRGVGEVDGRAGPRRPAAGTRSARVTPSSAPATASRTRIHRRFTVQDEVRSRTASWPLVLGGADHRGERAFEGPKDLAHRDVGGRTGQLVAAVRATGRDDKAGVTQARTRAARDTRGACPQRRRSRRSEAGPAPKCRPSWTINRTPYSPFVLNATAPVPWNAAGARSGRCRRSGSSGRRAVRMSSSIPSDLVGMCTKARFERQTTGRGPWGLDNCSIIS